MLQFDSGGFSLIRIPGARLTPYNFGDAQMSRYVVEEPFEARSREALEADSPAL